MLNSAFNFRHSITTGTVVGRRRVVDRFSVELMRKSFANTSDFLLNV